MKNLFARFKRWLVTPPPPGASFFTNLRKAARVVRAIAVHPATGHQCEWEHRCDPGEEEHGKNHTKRFCKSCGREQHAFYHRYGNTRITWQDAHHE